MGNNTGSEAFPVIIRDDVYRLTLSEMTDLHEQVWTQLKNRETNDFISHQCSSGNSGNSSGKD